MVTQTPPLGSKLDVECPNAEYRRALPDTRAAGSDVVLERERLASLEATGEVAVPPLTKGSVARIVAALLSVHDWLSGAPLTQRDRRVREIEDADCIRRAGALSFIY